MESLKASARFWLWIRATVPVSLTPESRVLAAFKAFMAHLASHAVLPAAGASKNLPPQAKALGYYTLAGFTVPPRLSLEALREAIKANVLRLTYIFPSLHACRVTYLTRRSPITVTGSRVGS